MPHLSRFGLNRPFPASALKLALLVLISTTACGTGNRTVNQIAQDTQNTEDFDNSLTFNSVTLEEFDKQGRLWWSVKAKQANYSKDKKVARVQAPNGQFFQDGKSILKVVAQTGEMQQDGQTVYLRGQVVATDTRDGLVLRGDELEWQPRTDTVIVRNKVTGTHRRLNVSTREARFFSRKRQAELEGQVVATATDPALQLKSDRLVWSLNQEIVTSDRPIQINRFVNKVPMDQASADRGVVNLKTKTANLKQNAQVTMASPSLRLTSNSLIWNVDARTIAADQPVTIVNRQQGVTLAGNQGQLNLNTNILNLAGDVRGVGERNQARINADRLVWNVRTQQFEAEGGVRYVQANPPFNLTGPKASGTLKNQNIVISGGRVVTEFVP